MPAPLSSAAQQVRAQIILRMRAEQAADLSEAEIVRTLKGCVLGGTLIRMAGLLRDLGHLTPEDLQAVSA